MKLEGTWCTEDIYNEHLQLGVFSITEKISFWNSVMNATSCFSKGQKSFKKRIRVNFQRTNLFEWASKNHLVHFSKTKVWYCERSKYCWLGKRIRQIRLCFKSYRNTKNFRWFLWLFTTDALMSLNGICKVTFISTGLKFRKLKRCWKKINNEIAKK